jgi:hypothetical protein
MKCRIRIGSIAGRYGARCIETMPRWYFPRAPADP